MPTPVNPPDRGGNSRRGCRRTCLGCTLLVAVIVVGAAAAWMAWGRPWLEERRAAVDRAVPGLRVVLGLARGRVSFGPRGLAPPLRRAGHAGFPEEVWLPASGGPTAVFSGGGTAVAVLELPQDTGASRAAAWRREMATRGWKRVPVPDPPDATALLFLRDTARCTVELVPTEAGTVRIWIRYQRTGGG